MCSKVDSGVGVPPVWWGRERQTWDWVGGAGGERACDSNREQHSTASLCELKNEWSQSVSGGEWAAAGRVAQLGLAPPPCRPPARRRQPQPGIPAPSRDKQSGVGTRLSLYVWLFVQLFN
ncbi:hypothetical protein E2C01_087823 [Portunus trituberculatus]|uniref:Uncharacterized protein n=1 Tax=Portunus trituberculatus TaxID=210409 RepID=A0A5B7JHI8_PORTR|nr:hypothetical protein [Portunus trituberculatus]